MDLKANELAELEASRSQKDKEIEDLKQEVEEMKQKLQESLVDGSNPADLAKQIEEKDRIIKQLKASQSGDKGVYDDTELSEVKNAYQQRMDALDEALKTSGSKSMMQKYLKAEIERSRKNEERVRELIQKTKEMNRTVEQKDKEIAELKNHIDSLKEEQDRKLKEAKEEWTEVSIELKRENDALREELKSLKEAI